MNRLRLAPALLATGLVGLAGCQMPDGGSSAAIASARNAGMPSAIYPDFPMSLFEAQAAFCTGPGMEVVRPSATEIRCESLLPPSATGSAILEFDGTVEDLPRLVIAFLVERQADGSFLVLIDDYLRVPQRTGGIRVVRFEDQERDASARELLRRAGGQPL